MTITDRTRKLLWGRSLDGCAMCGKPLTEDALSPHLPGLILGEEAHIVARSEDGPRGRSGDRSDIDGYANLILLCADDHTRVDTYPEMYTVEFLCDVKKAHEARAPNLPTEWEPIRTFKYPGEDDIPLTAIITGEAVWNLLEGAGVYKLGTLQGDERPEASDAADAFLTSARDWAEIADTVRDRGFTAVRDAQRNLQDLLGELWDFGLFAYGRRLNRIIKGGVAPPAPFIVAELAVLTADEVRKGVAPQ